LAGSVSGWPVSLGVEHHKLNLEDINQRYDPWYPNDADPDLRNIRIIGAG